jgi:hypothetical protein
MRRLLQSLAWQTGDASTVGPDLTPEEFQQAIYSLPAASPSSSKRFSERKPYKYKSLKGNSIRLVKITGLGQVLTVKIQHFKLEECPRYWAISYHWSKDSQPREFLTNRNAFSASSDVVDILNHIGYCETQEKTQPSSILEWATTNSSDLGRFPGQEQILIWIDAVCINQKDKAEKVTQIAIMGNIYRQAAKVVVWLGRPENDSDLVLTALSTSASG